MQHIDPLASLTLTAKDIVDFLTNTDADYIKIILETIFKEYKPETEYEEPSGSYVYDLYSTVSTYLISTARDTIYKYTRTRGEELEQAIKEINNENKIRIIHDILTKPFSHFKSTSVNNVLLHSLMRSLTGYDPEAKINDEQPLITLNNLLTASLRSILDETLKAQLMEKRRSQQKTFQEMKNQSISQIKQIERNKIIKESELYNNEIIFSKSISDESESFVIDQKLCFILNEYNNLVAERDRLLQQLYLAEKKYQHGDSGNTDISQEQVNLDDLANVGRQFESLFLSNWLSEDLSCNNNKSIAPHFVSDFFEKYIPEEDDPAIKNEIDHAMELKKQARQSSMERDRSKDVEYRRSVFEQLIKEDYKNSNSEDTGKPILRKYSRSQLIFAYSPDSYDEQLNLEISMGNSGDQKTSESLGDKKLQV